MGLVFRPIGFGQNPGMSFFLTHDVCLAMVVPLGRSLAIILPQGMLETQAGSRFKIDRMFPNMLQETFGRFSGRLRDQIGKPPEAK